MVIVWILLGILALFVLAMSLPLKLSLRYVSGCEPVFQVKYLLFNLYDSGDTTDEESPAVKKSKGKATGTGSKAGQTLLAFLGLGDLSSGDRFRLAMREKGLVETVGGACSALGDLFTRLFRLIKSGRFRRFRLEVAVGDPDPAEAARRYGLLCAVVYAAAAPMVPPKKQRINLYCDFERTDTAVSFEGEIHYLPWRFWGFLLGLLWRYIRREDETT